MTKITKITQEDVLLDHVSSHLDRVSKLDNALNLGNQFALGLPAIIADDVAALTEELQVEVEESAAIGEAMIELIKRDGPVN